ncbi:MAG TPA: bifunctional UDP-sugar hydrolase/5'-nucleotidase [Candidatus Eisenbacteria bacterium]|nr:bifunctional UDP-sugar hydrolase/5'-nucleotidase [Candidatus Eisenbacteria bacterium]
MGSTRGFLRGGIAAIVAFAAVLVFAPLAAAKPPPVGIDSLVVLHTNDLHSHLFPFERGEGGRVGGAAARKALIERERERTPDLLLLDAGDVVQGTPVYNLFRGEADAKAMGSVGYDAVVLGNHDLDDGPQAWLRLVRIAGYQALTANVFADADSPWVNPDAEEVPAEMRRGARWVGGATVLDAARLRYLARPYVIRPWRGKRVAIFGLTTRDLTKIVLFSRNGGVAVADPIAVARRLVPALRARADYVIALTHIGVSADKDLAAKVPGIDLIVGGHSHTELKRPAYADRGSDPWQGGTPIVQAGAWGDRLGRTVLSLSGGRPVGATTNLLRVRPADGEDSILVALLRPYQDSVRVGTGAIVFHTDRVIERLDGNDVESPLGSFVAEVVRETGRGDIGLVNTGGIRAPLPKGDVTVGDIVSVLPFDNTVVTVPMRGDEVQRLLNFVARRVGKSGFAQLSGVSFIIRNGRATSIRVGDSPLESERIYRVATIDYLYEGGDGYTQFRSATAGEVDRTGVLLHEAAVHFLRRRPDYEFRTDGRVVWEGGAKVLPTLQRK